MKGANTISIIVQNHAQANTTLLVVSSVYNHVNYPGNIESVLNHVCASFQRNFSETERSRWEPVDVNFNNQLPIDDISCIYVSSPTGQQQLGSDYYLKNVCGRVCCPPTYQG